jgi:predicted aldo/keto reductase-like oxidoreductase
MIYSEYGQTGKQVSAVGFGGMRFDKEKSNEQNSELLLYARDKGINYFDTAPGYCTDTSEDIFGIALPQMPGRGTDYYVSTKGMPTAFDTAQKAKDAVRKSLDRLKVDKIDFYHVWCIRKLDHYELAMKPGGQYEGLLQCKEEGLIDNIVVSTHLPGSEVEKLIEKKEFDGVLLGVNILNFQYRWTGVRAAHAAGLGVVAMNPLTGGVIPEHEKDFEFLASDGETPVEAALRFCISCPEITIALNGFTTREHIDMACNVADNCTPFTETDLDRIKANVSENMDSLCTACGYCLGVCPQNLTIPPFMHYYNEKLLAKKSDKEMVEGIDFVLDWGVLVPRTAEANECTACGECEEVCTQHINISKRMAKIAKWQKKADR